MDANATSDVGDKNHRSTLKIQMNMIKKFMYLGDQNEHD